MHATPPEGIARIWRNVAVLGAVGAASLLAATPSATARLADENPAVETYGSELRHALQTQQKLVDALNRLLSEDRELRSTIARSVARANEQLRRAEYMATLRLVRTPASDDDDDDEPRERIVDLSNTRNALRADALQVFARLPSLKASLGRTHQQLEKVEADGEVNRLRLRGLADPWGRRSVAEAERAIAVMDDALLANPQDDGARTIRALALLRLGRPEKAEEELTFVVQYAGPWYDLALAARGYLRAVAQPDADATRRQKGAADLNRAIGLKSRQAEPLLFRALASWRNEKWSQAETDLKSALRLRPDHIDGLRLSALLAVVNPRTERKLEDAENAAQRACDLTTERNPVCLEALAAVQARRGLWDAADETLAKAIALGDGRVAPRLTAQQAAYRERKMPDEFVPVDVADVPVDAREGADRAEEQALEELRQPPSKERPLDWRRRGRFFALSRRWDAARVNYRNVGTFNPLNHEGFLYACLAALADDRHDYQAFCRSVFEGSPNLSAAHMASVAPDSGIPPAEVLRLATSSEADAAALARASSYVQALAYYRAGRWGEARTSLRAAIDLAPRLPAGDLWRREGLGLRYQLLALVEAREGRIEAAREAAREAGRLIQEQPPKAKELFGDAELGAWLEFQLLHREFAMLVPEPR